MSGSTEHRAFETPTAARRERILNLTTARKMIPLVRSIVEQLVAGLSHLDSLQSELDRLEQRRRELSWPERNRRYALRDELTHLEQTTSEMAAELNQLGIYLLDGETGRVGFPTLVNNRPAFFAWWIGETEIRFWHFEDEVKNRTIPLAWLQQEGITLSGQP